MPQGFTFSSRPEIEEALLRRMQQEREDIEAATTGSVAQARSEALARGRAGDPFEAQEVGAARAGGIRALSDLRSRLAGEAAQIETEDRRTREAREFQRGERLGSQEFGAGEAEKGRLFGHEERIGSEKFSKEERLGGQEFVAAQAEFNREFSRLERLAQEAFQAGQTGKAQEFQKQMQELQNQYQAGESQKQKDFAKQMQEMQNIFAKGERVDSQQFQADQAKLDRLFRENLVTLGKDAEASLIQLRNELAKQNKNEERLYLDKKIQELRSKRGSIVATPQLGGSPPRQFTEPSEQDLLVLKMFSEL